MSGLTSEGARAMRLSRAEFEALPDVTQRGVALYTGEDDGLVHDPVTGYDWLVGWLDGKRVRRRFVADGIAHGCGKP